MLSQSYLIYILSTLSDSYLICSFSPVIWVSFWSRAMVFFSLCSAVLFWISMLSIIWSTIALLMPYLVFLHCFAVSPIFYSILLYWSFLLYRSFINPSSSFSFRISIRVSHFSIVNGLVVIQFILFFNSIYSTICKNSWFSSSSVLILPKYSFSFILNFSLMSLIIIKYYLFSSSHNLY